MIAHPVNDSRWKTRPLAELVQFQRGLTYKKSDEVPFSGNAVLRANNIDRLTGMLNLDEIRYIRDDVEVHDRLKVRPGTLLICTASGSKSHLGKVALVEDALDFAFGGFMGLLIPKPGLDPRYLFYVTRSSLYDDYIDSLSDGANINNLKFSDLGTFAVPLPPLEEQQRIVAVLDQAFAALDRARALTEANLADAEELFQQTVDSLLADRADWPKRPLKELGKTQTGGTPKSSEKGHYGQHIPFIKPGDFARDGSLNYGNEGLSEEGALSARRVPVGSALMVCIGATIGKAGYCTQDVTTNQQINALTPHAGTDGRFIYYNFIKSSFQNEVIAKSGQATLPIINKSKWSELVIGVPADLSVQAGVADKLQAMRLLVDQALASYAQKLKALAELRQSLLHKAFAGELT